MIMKYQTLPKQASFDSGTNSTTITGTATITMREGPVPNVPTTIEIAQDKVIAITPDPAALENHWKYANIRISGLAGNDGTDADEDETWKHD